MKIEPSKKSPAKYAVIATLAAATAAGLYTCSQIIEGQTTAGVPFEPSPEEQAARELQQAMEEAFPDIPEPK